MNAVSSVLFSDDGIVAVVKRTATAIVFNSKRTHSQLGNPTPDPLPVLLVRFTKLSLQRRFLVKQNE